MAAYEADYVTRDGRLVIDDPEIRRRLVKAIDSYTAIYRKGCTPPDSVTWDRLSATTRQFLAQAVVMTPNQTLSIPNALKRERPRTTTRTPPRSNGRSARTARPFPIGAVIPAMVFKEGGNVAHRQGVRPLPRGRGLARALSRLLRRAHAAADAEAARRAVLARPERPAPHGRGDAGRSRPLATTTRGSRATGGTTGFGRSKSGRRRSTASPPRASAPSRRSTRRSPGSSRSWRSERSVCLDVSVDRGRPASVPGRPRRVSDRQRSRWRWRCEPRGPSMNRPRGRSWLNARRSCPQGPPIQPRSPCRGPGAKNPWRPSSGNRNPWRSPL